MINYFFPRSTLQPQADIHNIVNREEGLEGRQTSKAFALIGFRC